MDLEKIQQDTEKLMEAEKALEEAKKQLELDTPSNEFTNPEPVVKTKPDSTDFESQPVAPRQHDGGVSASELQLRIK